MKEIPAASLEQQLHRCPECGHELDLPPPTVRGLGDIAMTIISLNNQDAGIAREMLDRQRQEEIDATVGDIRDPQERSNAAAEVAQVFNES